VLVRLYPRLIAFRLRSGLAESMMFVCYIGTIQGDVYVGVVGDGRSTDVTSSKG
jgi:hypothetical protein